VNSVIFLSQDKRGVQVDATYIDSARMVLKYKLPLSEIITHFYDRLKEVTSGFATFDYEEAGFEETSLTKVTMSLNNTAVEPLSFLCHKSKSVELAKGLTHKLKKVIDRQLFSITIQATIGGKVIAREDITAIRKNVIAKCYGGDISRKRKLLEKQKEGKKKMKMLGNVPLNQEAFLAILKKDSDDQE